MLTIRMQRTGRKGHAMFRIIVQDSRLTPTSGKVVAPLGSYDPHAKTVILDKEKAAFYLEHGAQPSTRVIRVLKGEGVKLPDWVKQPVNKERKVKNAEKRRSTSPAKPVEQTPAPTEVPATETDSVPAQETPADDTAAKTDTAETSETVAEEPSTEEPAKA